MIQALALGSNVLGGLFGMIGRGQERSAAKKYAAQVEQAARADAIQQFTSLGRRGQDVIQQGAQQIRNIMRQGTLEQGQVTASAGSAGVTGASVDALRDTFEKQTLTRYMASKLDTETELENIQGQKMSIAAQASARINQARAAVPQKQNIFGQLFQIGSSALTTYKAFE